MFENSNIGLVPKSTPPIQRVINYLRSFYMRPLGGFMNKFLLFLLLSVVSSFALADSTDIRNFLFDGSADYQEVNLSTEKTRTEYRTVQVPSTCYRTVYRRVCSPAPRNCRQVCRNGNCRRVCSGGGGTVCRTVPSTQPFPCMRTETRAYQVHDYYVETTARFEFNNTDVANDAAENFTMKMIGEVASLSVNSSKNYIIVLDKQQRAEQRQAGVKYVDITYKINFVPTAQLNEVLGNGIQKVKLKDGVLNFHLGAGFNFDNFIQNIKIYQNRRVGSDILLLDRVLTASEANVQSTSAASILSVNLKNLGISLPSKMRVILDTKYKVDENKVLNRGELKLDASANWVFR